MGSKKFRTLKFMTFVGHSPSIDAGWPEGQRKTAGSEEPAAILVFEIVQSLEVQVEAEAHVARGLIARADCARG